MFVKFLNAAKMYKASVAIMGGDMTGKMIVPIVKLGDGKHKARLLGNEAITNTNEELQKLEFSIRYNGFYPYYTDRAEMEELNNDQTKVDALFTKLMTETLKRWLDMAEERLKDVDTKVYMTPGNDDSFAIDSVLNSSTKIINPEDKVVKIDAHHEMISSGYSNPTPWDSPERHLKKNLRRRLNSWHLR